MYFSLIFIIACPTDPYVLDNPITKKFILNRAAQDECMSWVACTNLQCVKKDRSRDLILLKSDFIWISLHVKGAVASLAV